MKCIYCDYELQEDDIYFELGDIIACEECEQEFWEEIKDEYKKTWCPKAEYEDSKLDQLRGK